MSSVLKSIAEGKKRTAEPRFKKAAGIIAGASRGFQRRRKAKRRR